MTSQPWVEQGDAYGLCNSMYYLLTQRAGSVQLQRTGQGERFVMSPVDAHLNKGLWMSIFDQILNGGEAGMARAH